MSDEVQTKDSSGTLTLSTEDDHGNPIEREVHQLIDARHFLGTALYPYLIMAANPQLRAIDIWEWLYVQSKHTPGAERPPSWIRKRRWMMQKPGARLRPGVKADADGMTARALEFMANNPELSLRDIVRQLKRSGIRRSREWCRRNRVAV